MNTKFLLLFIVFFLIIKQSISSGTIHNQSQQLPISQPSNNENIKPSTDESGIWNFNINMNAAIDASHQNSDDDCKFHLFHFNRFTKRRTKWLLCFIFKMILVTAFASSFLVGFLPFIQ